MTEPVILPVTETRHFDSFARMMAEQDPWKRMGYGYDACRSSFEGDWRNVLGIFVAGAATGFAVLQPLGTFRGYIQTICIDSVHQRKGYGNRLLDYCEQEIARSSPNVFICVSEFNEGAQRLYRSRGYETIGILRDFVKAGFNEILMRKTSGPFL